jgi:hypothetical protein
MKPGSPEKYYYEYIRNGTANIFMAVNSKQEKGSLKLLKEEQ